MKPPLIMYHAHCADGFGAAFAAWKKFGSSADYVAVEYNKPIPVPYEDRDVYVLDFSFSKEITAHLLETTNKLIWLDHHKSAFENWCGEYYPGKLHVMEAVVPTDSSSYICLDDTRSGALIAWEYFHPEDAVPTLIRHIDDYDRWQFKLLGTKEFIKSLWAYTPWTFEFFDNSLNSERVGEMISEGAAILRAHNQNVDAVIAATELPCTITWFEQVEISNQFDIPYKKLVSSQEVGAVGLAANCPAHLTSDVGTKLALKSGTYGLCWFQRADSKINCSLRSSGNYDVSAIAKRFGGGGHKNAAGFTVASMSQLQKWFYPDRRSI